MKSVNDPGHAQLDTNCVQENKHGPPQSPTLAPVIAPALAKAEVGRRESNGSHRRVDRGPRAVVDEATLPPGGLQNQRERGPSGYAVSNVRRALGKRGPAVAAGAVTLFLSTGGSRDQPAGTQASPVARRPASGHVRRPPPPGAKFPRTAGASRMPRGRLKFCGPR